MTPTVVELHPDDIRNAAALMRRLDLALRTPDAIHVALAGRLGSRLATLDRRMATDAALAGVPILVVEP